MRTIADALIFDALKGSGYWTNTPTQFSLNPEELDKALKISCVKHAITLWMDNVTLLYVAQRKTGDISIPKWSTKVATALGAGYYVINPANKRYTYPHGTDFNLVVKCDVLFCWLSTIILLDNSKRYFI